MYLSPGDGKGLCAQPDVLMRALATDFTVRIL
jgi:hypothetical protein